MIEIFLKNAKGLWEPEGITEKGLFDWFKSNTDKEGNVLQDIVVTVPVQTKATDDSINFVLSDMGLDRDFERIDPAGWNLKTYKLNPIILWSHDQFQPAIGKMEDVKVKDGQLIGKAVFVSKEIDPFGWSIGEKIKAGFLNAGSVGFRSRKVEILDDAKDGTRLIHRQQDLFEYSIVNIPSLVTSGVRKETKEDNTEIETSWSLFSKEQEASKPDDTLSLVFGNTMGFNDFWTKP